jgi:hypothetical protein
MRIFAIPFITLVIGVGIGLFITKVNKPAVSGYDAESSSPYGGASSNLRTRPASSMPSAGKSTTAKTASTPRSLAALMKLAGDNWNGQVSIAFLKAVEGLGAGEIAALMIDLEKLDPSEGGRDQLFVALMNRWAVIDPDGAWDAATHFKDKNFREQIIAAVIGAISHFDLNKAKLMLSGIKDPQTRKNALYSFFEQAASEDPEEAFRLLASESLGSEKFQYYNILFTKWAEKDPDAAIEKFSQIQGFKDQQMAMNIIIGNLAQTDPAKAAAILGGTVVTNQNSHQVGVIVGAWIKSDQTAALAWLDSLDLRGATLLQNVHGQFLQTWASEDAPAASRYALGIKDEKARQQAISSVVGAWGINDPQAAKEWIMTSLEGDLKYSSLQSLIQNLSHQDHAMALRYYQEATAKLAPEAIPKNLEGATASIAHYWAQDDPKAASQWVMTLPEGDFRTTSIRSLVDALKNNDIKGAAEFVDTLPVGKERDQAVASMVTNPSYQGDAQCAFDWAASISDTSMRETMIRIAARQWQEYDRAAARAAVASAVISSEARDDILKGLEN